MPAWPRATRRDLIRRAISPSSTINFGFDKISSFASVLALPSFITGH